ncbi:MAG: HlyD family efflux transporter periplasmic adaptor subunit [Lacipirellulaceae bacterium]
MSASESTNVPPARSAPASPGAVQESDAVLRAKREIQGILQQISELSRGDATTDQFYAEFLNRVVAALAAVGGAIWTMSETGGLQLVYQINLRQTGLAEDPIAQAQHGRLLNRVLTGQKGEIVAPHSGFSSSGALITSEEDDKAAANATDFLLVLAPMHNDQGPQGVVEVFQRGGTRPQVQQGYLNFLHQTCQLAGDFLRSQRLRHLADKQSMWDQLESFTRRAHEGLDVREASYTIANEGRRLIGADRVTVAVGHGARVVIEAISGQDVFDKRSNVATLLTKMARAVAKTGDDVWYTGDTADFAPQVEKTVDAYVDESQTKAMAILPLLDRRGFDPDAPNAEGAIQRRQPKVIGALIVEQMVDNRLADGFTQRVNVVRNHSETALANAMEHQGVFLMPVWKFLGKGMWLFRGRTLPKTLLGIATAIGVVTAVLLVPKDFTLEGDGKLRPAELRNVFAQIDGEVVRVNTKHEQSVTQGQTLVELKSLELDKEITGTRGQLDTTLTEQRSLRADILKSGRDLSRSDRDQKESRLAKLAGEIATLDRELELLEARRKQLSVTSPIDGQVITFKVEEQLTGRPVRRGQVLLEVANPAGDWVLEVSMPEKRMGHITRALRDADLADGKEDGNGELQVEFLLATTTETTLKGRLLEENVATSAEVRGEEGNTVVLKVLFDQDEFRKAIPNPKVGSEVKARVACGKASIAYAYLHDLVDFLRAKVLFRL